MRTKFTKLMCACVACFFALSVLGQGKKEAIRIVEGKGFPEKEVKFGASEKEQPDSVVMYDNGGYRTGVFYSVSPEPELYYSDYSNRWVISVGHFDVSLWPIAEYDVKYNSSELVESMTYFYNDKYHLFQFQYNANDILISSDDYTRPLGSIESAWMHVTHAIYSYDAYGNWVGYQNYFVDGPIPELVYPAYSARVDNKGRIVYSEYNMGNAGGQQSQYHIKYYIWYYSDGSIPNASVENNNSVGNNNKGNFDVTVNIPTDSIVNGSFVVTLPEGFTLDENNTQLTVNFGNFDLVITPQDNNSWLLEIKPKATRSMLISSEETANPMVHITYTVEKNVSDSTYNFTVDNIRFGTPGNDIMPLPAITVPVKVNRSGTGIKSFANNNIWVSGKNLFIRTDNACIINIYTVSGQLFKQQTVKAGETIIPLPQGTYIVKTNVTVNKFVVR